MLLNLKFVGSYVQPKKTKFITPGWHYLLFCSLLIVQAHLLPGQSFLEFTPKEATGGEKLIVLLAGDESYRSEESMPMLAKILTHHHGFRTIVLFSTDPSTGEINPDELQHTSGLENLQQADLLIIATRFREYPDEQMAYIDEYLRAGKPVIGIRTATHAFRYKNNPNSKYARYDFTSKHPGWEGGFGKRILGDTWVCHHGKNGEEGTRAFLNGLHKMSSNSSILKGVEEIVCISDTYCIKNLPASAEVLMMGIPIKGFDSSSPAVWEKGAMPVAWTSVYSSETGKTGRVFTTTMGASIDFQNEGLRRLLVNASYWALGLEDKIPDKSVVDFVGEYIPTMFGFGTYTKGKYPKDYR